MTQLKRNKALAAQVVREVETCEVCRMVPGTQVHHKEPLTRGGADVRGNLALLCDTCHRGAPETTEEFQAYQDLGGVKCKYMLAGWLVRAAHEGEGCDSERELVAAAQALCALRWLTPGDVVTEDPKELVARMIRAAREDESLAALFVGAGDDEEAGA